MYGVFEAALFEFTHSNPLCSWENKLLLSHLSNADVIFVCDTHPWGIPGFTMRQLPSWNARNVMSSELRDTHRSNTISIIGLVDFYVR